MRVGIIGAGFTGLAAAYYLQKKGHKVTIFEKDEKPGGLAVGFEVEKWDYALEKHYHHFFTNDKFILDLAKEVNVKIITRRPKTCVYIKGKKYQLDSPLMLLKFELLSIVERLRMGATLGLLRFNPYWKPLEKIRAEKILKFLMGKKSYGMIWDPQMTAKFGDYKKGVSLAWFWARIAKRTTSLAYPEEGFLNFAKKIEQRITGAGGEILYLTEVINLTSEKKPVILFENETGKKGERTFDKVIVTSPGFLFAKISPQLSSGYKESLTNLEGLGAINLILRLRKKFLTDNTYWLSICDKSFPITAVVEHTNYMDPSQYNNEHIVYVGKYLKHSHPYFSFSPQELLKEYDPYLEKLHRGYRKDLIDFHVFKAPFAQPIIPLNYSKIMPSHNTPLKNVYLANIQQVYPWDRGTNYAVELGQNIAKIINENN